MDEWTRPDPAHPVAGFRITAPPDFDVHVAALDQVQWLSPTGQLLHHTLQNSGFERTRTLALAHSNASSGHVAVAVPAPKPGNNALLVVHDATGALTWHVPDGVTPSAATVPRPPDQPLTFTVPQTRFAAGSEHAGLLARITGLAHHFHVRSAPSGEQKLLSVLEYPVEHVVGRAGADLFKAWEDNKHPSVLRWFPAQGGLREGEALSPTNWHQLAEGPALLFVHGIFSSCGSAFGGIADDERTWTELRRRYGNRIIGFDHPTGSYRPDQNAGWLLDQLPDVHLDLDIVCHSRGGLVARSLAAQAPAWRTDKHSLTIGRIVFAATPNGGSQITVADKWGALINRLSSVLTLPAKLLPAPAGAIVEVLAGLLEIVKVVGIGVALDLPGLEAMTPGGRFLRALVAETPSPRPEYFAAAADFEPGPVLANLFHKLDDEAQVVDREIFDGVANDIAVPTVGVWNPAAVTGDPPDSVPGFPLDAAHQLDIRGSVYWHCSYFDDPDVRAALLRWLPGVPPE